MITSEDCFKKYGDPVKYQKKLKILDIPPTMEVGNIPKKIYYCNPDMEEPLLAGFCNLINRGLIDELHHWGGCFFIRPMRNGKSMSLHSWAVAFDVNEDENPQGKTPTLSAGFVKCFTDAGFDWGGNWPGKFKDGMHFQLAKI